MTDTPNLQLLKSRLESEWPADGRLTLTPDAVPTGDVQAFLRTLPQPLVLQSPAIAPTGAPTVTRLDVTGQVDGTWTVPHLNGGVLSDIQVTLTFIQTQPSAPVLSSFAVTRATLSLGGRETLVSGQVLPGTVQLYLSLSPSQTPAGSRVALTQALNALTNGQAFSLAPPGVSLFDQLQPGDVQLTFGFDPSATASYGVTATSDGDWEIIDGGLFAFKQLSVTVWSEFTPSKTGPAKLACAGSVHATTRIASSDFQIVLFLDGDGQLEFDVMPQDGQVVPGLLDLAEQVGGDSLKSAVQTGVQALGLGDITIDRVSIGFDVGRRKLLYLSLYSHLTLAGGRIDLIAQLPDFQFYGGLPTAPPDTALPSGISVRALAAQLMGESADLPDITITQLSLFAYPGRGAYNLSVLTEEDWNWDLSGTGTGPKLMLQQLGFDLGRTPQAITGGLSTALDIGGFVLNMSAQYQGKGAGWVFTGTGGMDHSVPLGTFIQDAATKLGVSVTAALLQAVQGVEIEYLSVTFDTQQKSFQFTADTTATGQLPFGLKSYELETRAFLTSAVDPGTGQRSFTGHLEADLDIGPATFVVSYDFGPDDKTVTGSWRSTDGSTLGFADIAEALGIDHTVSPPAGLDLGLKTAAFKYQVADSIFTLSAESHLFGDAFFTAGKGSPGGWEFVFGVDFAPSAKLSSLPVVGTDLKAADFLTFKQAGILLASTQLQNYTLPILSPLPPPPPTPTTSTVGRPFGGRAIRPVATGASLQLTPGASFVAVLDFKDSSGDARIKNLALIVAQDELVLQASVGSSGLSLYITFAGAVGIPAGGKGKLTLKNPALLIALTTETVFQLQGGILLSVNGAVIDATARLIIDESEAQVAVTVSGDGGALPPPPGVKGLHLLNFGIAMGVFFEPPGADLGVQGKLRIGETQGTRDDEFAIVMEMIEEVPNVLYLSFYIDRLDLGQMVTLFTDKPEPDSVKALEIVRASDLGFHWSENVVVLPDGTIAQPGFGASGSIQIFSFGAHVDLEVGFPKGFSGRAEMSPINLKNVLQVTGDGKGIKRTYQQLNGQWRLVNNSGIVRRQPAPPTREDVVVQPGGPVIAFNALHPPFVHVDLRVTLFDRIDTRVDVDVSDKGFSFTLTFDVAGIEKFDLSAVLKDLEHFEARAEFQLGLDARVGPIHVRGVDCGVLHLVTTVDARMALTLDPARFRLDLQGQFDFEGLKFAIPTLSLSVAPASLKELPGRILQQIRDHADAVFSALFNDVHKWADMIARGVVSDVKDIALSLQSAYKLSPQDAARVKREAGKQTAKLLKDAGYSVNDVGDTLKSAYGATADEAAGALKDAGYAVDQTGNFIKGAYGLTADQLGNVLKGVGYAGDQIKGYFKSLGGEFKKIGEKLDPTHW